MYQISLIAETKNVKELLRQSSLSNMRLALKTLIILQMTPDTKENKCHSIYMNFKNMQNVLMALEVRIVATPLERKRYINLERIIKTFWIAGHNGYFDVNYTHTQLYTYVYVYVYICKHLSFKMIAISHFIVCMRHLNFKIKVAPLIDSEVCLF